jgi:integrase/recombinase XerD
LEAAPGPKYKAALSAAYGAGLRVSEVVALKVSDIDSERMLLHIEQGKGRKDRFAMLSPRLLELLRDWYRIARPALWLFPGRDPLLPLTTRQFNRAVHAAADRAAIKKRANNLQQSWRFDWEPPKAVLRDVWTIDWILGC